jgi:uncharacterized membrane protein YfcA
MLRYVVCMVVAVTVGWFLGQAMGNYVTDALAIRIIVAVLAYFGTFEVLLRLWRDHDSL